MNQASALNTFTVSNFRLDFKDLDLTHDQQEYTYRYKTYLGNDLT